MGLVTHTVIIPFIRRQCCFTFLFSCFHGLILRLLFYASKQKTNHRGIRVDQQATQPKFLLILMENQTLHFLFLPIH
ncbi:uncharacterized protein OCT59_003962 [Rhizophagus irregularis]|uniref:uncharacterized protein n=1 Tax=Rhizophagus irregularis TaxID=588596 RepID=UPI003328C1BC|nr:hypothetical protein OCT59_003962 [Rhizophagus irregularis]